MLLISITRRGRCHASPVRQRRPPKETAMTAPQTAVRPAATATQASRPVNEDVFSSFRLGDLELPNRLVMAPMTRGRAVDGNVPNPLAATYYAQRASAGLIVTEGTQVSPQGVGYIRTPGIHSAAQVAGWPKA